MESKIKRSSLRTASLLIIAFTLFTLFNSCSKSSNNSNTVSFIGTYCGTLVDGPYNSNDTIVVSAGGNSSSVIMGSKTAAGSVYTINGTTSGANLSIASQQVYINTYAENFTITGSGSLSGTTLQINMTFVSPSSVTTHWVFTGIKKI